MNLPERRRCGTTRDRITFKISPIGSLIEVLTNEYHYATLDRFCCSRPIRWGRSTLELPRSGRKRAVSVMTHHEARNIEAGASRVPYSVQLLSPDSQNSNRNKPGNRNARNSSFISDLIFSTRNKIRGGEGDGSEEFTIVCAEKPSPRATPNTRLVLGIKYSAACPEQCRRAVLSAASYDLESISQATYEDGSSILQPQVSGLQNLIATPASRNALNSPDINKTYRSNRNKTRGGSASFSERRNRS
jgi:hypothetical protein